MKKLTIALFALSILLMGGCKPSREKSVENIQILEKQLFSAESTSFDKEKADSLLNLYTVFIDKFPGDSLIPDYLFKSANLAMNSGNGAKAIEYFDRYITSYPDREKAALCLFFKAFVYENILRNLDKAKESYLLFVEKYPENDFADDAQMALQNLGKTPDQMIMEFEARKKADSTRLADSITAAKKKKRGK